ncbi:MAG: prolipoprotein diacylglyceryl transferase [Armatimonadetes bacterium]|nr:prolipoprotein diacylglyceryl transferase [Armatimonadota bacterium]
MIRILFEIGPVKVYSYGLMILVAFGAGLLWARKRAPRFDVEPGQIGDVAFFALLFGVLGARIGFILQELPYFLKNRDQLFTLQFQGLTSYGAFIAGALVFVFYARRHRLSAWRLLDVIAGPFLLGNAIGRVGCLLNGCCYGGVCTLPWGVPIESPFSPGRFLPELHHPAQIYESLMNLAGIFILLRLERKGLKSGQSFAAAMVLFGVGRFIYEFWRIGSTSSTLGPLPVTDAQLIALAAAVLGAIFYRRFGYSSGSPDSDPPAAPASSDT